MTAVTRVASMRASLARMPYHGIARRLPSNRRRVGRVRERPVSEAPDRPGGGQGRPVGRGGGARPTRGGGAPRSDPRVAAVRDPRVAAVRDPRVAAGRRDPRVAAVRDPRVAAGRDPRVAAGPPHSMTIRFCGRTRRSADGRVAREPGQTCPAAVLVSLTGWRPSVGDTRRRPAQTTRGGEYRGAVGSSCFFLRPAPPPAAGTASRGRHRLPRPPPPPAAATASRGRHRLPRPPPRARHPGWQASR